MGLAPGPQRSFRKPAGIIWLKAAGGTDRGSVLHGVAGPLVSVAAVIRNRGSELSTVGIGGCSEGVVDEAGVHRRDAGVISGVNAVAATVDEVVFHQRVGDCFLLPIQRDRRGEVICRAGIEPVSGDHKVAAALGEHRFVMAAAVAGVAADGNIVHPRVSDRDVVFHVERFSPAVDVASVAGVVRPTDRWRRCTGYTGAADFDSLEEGVTAADFHFPGDFCVPDRDVRRVDVHVSGDV